MGWRPHLQGEVPHAKEPEARWRGGRQYQEACLEVLPAEDRARPHRRVPALGQGAPHCPVLVVPPPLANERPPLQGVSGVEDAAEDSVSRSVVGDGEVEEPVEGPGLTCRQQVRAGGAGLPRLNGCGKAGATPGRGDARGEASEWELRERREREEGRKAEAEELGAAGGSGGGEERSLFLPTPSFMASADEE